MAAAAVIHPTSNAPRAASCAKPGFNNKISQLKIAKVRKKKGRDICSVTIMVFMKEAPEIREATAATSEVGGEYSDMTAMKNKKKCAIQGLIPIFVIGGMTITADSM